MWRVELQFHVPVPSSSPVPQGSTFPQVASPQPAAAQRMLILPLLATAGTAWLQGLHTSRPSSKSPSSMKPPALGRGGTSKEVKGGGEDGGGRNGSHLPAPVDDECAQVGRRAHNGEEEQHKPQALEVAFVASGIDSRRQASEEAP
eukprot:CAMPEP_0180559538 /NCGR_PEP_ID=MMETSP1037_2-20121125/2350_1 /TAXON_ID=632150 /ORGANISM="Azadinium spinosum, Strain 3D9" /LENGTH=145 /DNA_ID=CAMNT_0022576017 /DNA_START=285 /DNA_END=722 /DNA_ORIENTATION=-